MKVIALDQNAISNLASPPSPVWSEILDQLKQGVSKRAIWCPTPTETISESVHLARAKREGIEKICAELSLGYFIRFPWQIIALEALAKVRPGTNTFPFWIPKVMRRSSDSENEKAAKAIWKEKDESEAELNPAAAAARSVLGADSKHLSIQQLSYESAVGWLAEVRRYLNKMRNDQLLGDEQFIIQQMCATLIELRVTDKEIAGLLRSIRLGEWLEIPTLACWFALDGLFLYDQLRRGRRFEYNDEWDKYRAGEAYHCADCFITDRSMAAALKQLKLSDPNDFQVFAVTETKSIVAYLEATI